MATGFAALCNGRCQVRTPGVRPARCGSDPERVSSPSDLAPGDLVFFHGLGHVGLYIGGGNFVHAPHSGDVVKISNLASYSGYDGAVRISG